MRSGSDDLGKNELQGLNQIVYARQTLRLLSTILSMYVETRGFVYLEIKISLLA